MTEGSGTITAGAAWGQALTAVALIGGLGAGLWVVGESTGSGGEPEPAACWSAGSGKTPAKAGELPPGQASGAELCTALHRPDLPDLLGIPGERAKSAQGGSSGIKPADGDREIHSPTAEVEFETYTVHMRASYGRVTVATVAGLLGDRTAPRTVLGRPAAFYSDRTISISLRPGGGSTSAGPGLPIRALVVARDPEDGGGSFEVSLWRSDGALPDDAVLLRVAEQVLPTVPGWDAPPGRDL
ncbi:DUF6215 domain-containing protein [Streptomyces sp. TBY4]|uniref:DUF6215 domain-containing protein n=1 Tax=Streptomyces sp. TBY4 TaxID=2962030 RepID=UPI0020B868DB|nr:DUF6215 domain-containing protein [Streptomyces sp. TBY4]MCP3757669.1 DUF6215 domain-containing protein [Streptomyces sp. TBY4]